MKSNEALLGPVGNNKTNGKQVYFLVTSKKSSHIFLREEIWIWLDFPKAHFILNFLPARNFAPPFHTPRFYASVEFEF